MHLNLRLIQQLNELVYSESCITNDRAKRATSEFFVVRHDNRCVWVGAPEDDVTASLAANLESSLFQCFHALTPGYNG